MPSQGAPCLARAFTKVVILHLYCLLMLQCKLRAEAEDKRKWGKKFRSSRKLEKSLEYFSSSRDFAFASFES
jgi:hypothetical protein